MGKFSSASAYNLGHGNTLELMPQLEEVNFTAVGSDA
jgi:hypothetical protein